MHPDGALRTRFLRIQKCRDIFYRRRHPYTWALLKSVPRVDYEKKQPLVTIEGGIPDMTNPPKGCAFCQRCPYAMNICSEYEPTKTTLADGHEVWCWLLDKRADLSKVPEEQIDLAWVPGAFEIPVIAEKMAASGKYDAVICLGAVIRGATSHYDYVCNEVSKGIASVSLQSKIPVMFGVLTTDNIEQAIERAGSKAGNKGYECAVGAIEMVNLMRVMEK